MVGPRQSLVVAVVGQYLLAVRRQFLGQSTSMKARWSCARCHRWFKSKSIRWSVCILSIYLLNVSIGFRTSLWTEKSFEGEYDLTITHLDIIQLENNAEKNFGHPTSILPDRLVVRNENLCGRSMPSKTLIDPRLLILVKSSFEHEQERRAIRLTWANSAILHRHDARLAFVVSKSFSMSDVLSVDV